MKISSSCLVAILMIPMALPAEGEEHPDLSVQGLGATMMWVHPSGLKSGIGAGLHANIQLYSKPVYLVPTLSYWSSSSQQSVFGTLVVDRDIRRVGLSLDLRFYLKRDRIFLPFIGVGSEIYYRRVKEKVSHSTESSVDGGTPFGQLGFDMPVGRAWEISLFLDLWGSNSVNLGITKALYPKSGDR